MVKLGVGIDHFAIMRRVPGAVALELPDVVAMVTKKGAKAITVVWTGSRAVVDEKDLDLLRRQPKIALHVRVGADVALAASDCMDCVNSATAVGKPTSKARPANAEPQ